MENFVLDEEEEIRFSIERKRVKVNFFEIL